MATSRIAIHDRIKFVSEVGGTAGTINPPSFDVENTRVDGFLIPSDTTEPGASLWPFLIEDEATGDWELGLFLEQFTSGSSTNANWDRGSSQTLASSNDGARVDFGTAANRTITLVDPALLVSKGYLEVEHDSGFPLSIESINRLQGVVIPSGYVFPCVQAPANAVTGQLGEGRCHTETSIKRAQTTNATTADVAAFSASTTSRFIMFVEVVVLAQRTSGSAPFPSKVITIRAATRDNGSGEALVGTISTTVEAEDAALSSATAAVVFSGNFTRVQVTGLATTNIDWTAKTTVTYMEPV